MKLFTLTLFILSTLISQSLFAQDMNWNISLAKHSIVEKYPNLPTEGDNYWLELYQESSKNIISDYLNNNISVKSTAIDVKNFVKSEEITELICEISEVDSNKFSFNLRLMALNEEDGVIYEASVDELDKHGKIIETTILGVAVAVHSKRYQSNRHKLVLIRVKTLLINYLNQKIPKKYIYTPPKHEYILEP